MIHELPLERRTLHGHFSRDLEPVLTVESGDSVRFSTLDAGWGMEGGGAGGRGRPRFEPRDPELDRGHPLVGPIAVRGARPGHVLAVRIDELRVGTYGFTDAGGWPLWVNQRLGLDDGDPAVLLWELDADAAIGRNQLGHEVELRPFLGVVGMPPPDDGIHPTGPPRVWGGNLDCTELTVGSTLLLPVPVEGALVSLGDAHARQGDGEVAGLAIECPAAAAQVTLELRDDLELRMPHARTDDAWVVMGVDEDLDEAFFMALDGVLELIEREQRLDRRHALALASAVVDFRVTQVVNGVRGVHAVLRDDAVRAG